MCYEDIELELESTLLQKVLGVAGLVMVITVAIIYCFGGYFGL